MKKGDTAEYKANDPQSTTRMNRRRDGNWFGKRVRRFFRMYALFPIQRLFRGWSESDLWNLDWHLARVIYPRLKSYIKSYSSGKFGGLCPGLIVEEYREHLIAEGHNWDAGRHFFTDDGADTRLGEIWLSILNSMLFSFEWSAKGEPIPPDCYQPNPLYKPGAEFALRLDDGNYGLNPEYGPENLDTEAYRQFCLKIQEGFINFGKYYQCLWD